VPVLLMRELPAVLLSLKLISWSLLMRAASHR
jgi:hypothetical protein